MAILQTTGVTGSLSISSSGIPLSTSASLFSVNGYNGRLLDVVDNLSGSLFSVNTIAGLPVLDVWSDNRIFMGKYNANDLVISGSRVGIGTKNPNQKLHIRGANDSGGVALRVQNNSVNSSASSSIQFTVTTADSYNSAEIKQDRNGGNNLSFLTDNATRLYISASGNVGIGTTNPSYKLDVDGSMRVSRGIVDAGSSAQWALSGGGTVTWSGTHILWSVRVIAIPVERTEFGNSGYIDITCPTSGTITYYNSSNVTTTVTCTSNGIPMATWEALYYEVTPGQTNTSDPTKFRLVNYQNSTWRPSSNWLLICVRNGDSPDGHIKWIPGQVNIPRLGGIYNSGTGLNNWQLSGSGTTNYVPKFTSATQLGNSNIFDNGTNVGIGTTSPNAKLRVVATKESTAAFVSSDATYGSLVDIAATTANKDAAIRYYATSGGWTVGIDSSKNFVFGRGVFSPTPMSDKPLFIQYSSGNVGIGTTSPSYKLDVSGSMRIRDDSANPTLTIEDRGTSNDPFIRFIPSPSTHSFAMGVDDSDGDKFKISYGANNTSTLGTNDRLTIDTSGNVGIGTSNPTCKLNVIPPGSIGASNINNSGLLIGTAAFGLGFDANEMYGIGGSGLNIGTLDAQPVRIAPNALLTLSVGTTGVVVSNPTNAAAPLLVLDNTGTIPSFRILQDSVSNPDPILVMRDSTNTNTVAFDTNGDSYITGSSTSAFGVGTISPQRKFQVKSSVRSITGSSAVSIITSLGQTYTEGEYYGGIGIAIPSSDGGTLGAGMLGVMTTNSLRTELAFVTKGADGGTAASEKVRISQDGNVGIGTKSPSSILHLSSTGPAILTIEADTDDITETDNARILLKQDGGSVVGRIGYVNNLNVLEITNEFNDHLSFGTNNTERVTIRNTGNVGIGLDLPSELLHLSSSTATDIRIQGTSDSTVQFVGPNTHSYTAGLDVSDANKFKISYTTSKTPPTLGTNDRFVIDTDGNVGIGTSSPTYRLHINGGVGINGNLTVSTTSEYIQLSTSGVTYKMAGGHVLSTNNNEWYKIAQWEVNTASFRYEIIKGSISYSFGTTPITSQGHAMVNFNVYCRAINSLTLGSPYVTYAYETLGNTTFKGTFPFRVVKTADVDGGSKTYELQVSPANNTSFGQIIWDLHYTKTDSNNPVTAYTSLQPTGSVISDARVSEQGNKVFLSGNVGIGTSSPEDLLSVGNINIGNNYGSGYVGIWLNGQTSTSTYNLLANGTNSDKNLYINRPTGGTVLFRENNGGTPHFRIKTGGDIDTVGNLGVGAEPSTDGRLYVYGAGNTSNFLQVANCNGIATNSTSGRTLAGYVRIYINNSVSNGGANAFTAGNYYIPVYS